MANKKKITKLISIIIAIVLMSIIFVSVMWMSTILFSHQKADITSKQYYAAQKSNKEMISQISSPVTVTLYFSEGIDSEYPELGVHKQYIERLLEQLQNYAQGKIKIVKKNPEPYSPAEYEAKDLGIRSFPDTENTKNLYFGAMFSNNKGQKSIIPYFSVQRQNYAEYDIMRNLLKLQQRKKAKVGVISFSGNISNWQIFKKIKEDYEVDFINYSMDVLPRDLSVLMLFNPQQLDVNLIYSLDQYLIHGGNLIIFTDPYAENIISKYPYAANNKNYMSPFFENLGLMFDDNYVVGDKALSQPEYQTTISSQINPLYINFKASDMNIPEFLGGNVNKISFSSAGELKIQPKKDVEYIELFTTKEGGLIETKQLKTSTSKEISETFQSDNNKHVLGYLLKGYFHSMFDKNIYEGSSLEKFYPAYLSQNIKESKILILSDSDFIADQNWNLSGYQKDAGVYDQIPSANNADFILSVIDYMTGNNMLAKIKVNYLINNEKNIAEQIYLQAFNKYKEQYLQKERESNQLQQNLNKFQADIQNQKVGISITKIQELDALHRQQQVLQEDIKKLNYQVQQESGYIMNKIIILNLLVVPLILLSLFFIFVKISIHRQKQKNMRGINE